MHTAIVGHLSIAYTVIVLAACCGNFVQLLTGASPPSVAACSCKSVVANIVGNTG